MSIAGRLGSRKLFVASLGIMGAGRDSRDDTKMCSNHLRNVTVHAHHSKSNPAGGKGSKTVGAHSLRIIAYTAR